MKFLKTLTIPGFMLLICFGAFSSDSRIKDESQRFYYGTDWYRIDLCYHKTGPANISAIRDEMTSVEKAIEGEFFEPRAFWEQPMDDQLKHLKDEIISCNLLETVKRHHDIMNVSYTSSPYGIPYKPEEEMAFREAIWPKIQKYITDNHLKPLSKEEFSYSLKINVEPDSSRGSIAPADAPLIRHFARYLCPLWKKDHNRYFEQYPSWFEQFILDPKEE